MNPTPRRSHPLTGGLLVLLLALAGCGAAENTGATPDADRRHEIVGGLPTGTLHLGSDRPLTLQVEMALTPQAQTAGLMYVEEVPDEYGMVFLWDSMGRYPFHMLNTLVPLDIAFWDDQMRIVDIQTMQPCGHPSDCPLYIPRADHIAAVEVRAGLLEETGVRVGDAVLLEE